MSRLLTLICVVLFSVTNAQYYSLKGIVTIQNSGNKPLTGAQVTSSGANPTRTLSDGSFILKYNSKRIGQAVIVSIKKQDYEIVNEKELSAIISDNILKVYACKKGERDKLRLSYYNISKKNIIRAFEDSLKKSDKNSGIAIDALVRARDEALLAAKNFSKKFSVINLDDCDQIYRKAFLLFEAGKLDSAINVLSDIELDARSKEIKEQYDNARKFDSLAKQQVYNADVASKKLASSYMLKANLSMQKLNMISAYDNYKKAVSIDSTNQENIYEFAQFLNWKGFLQESIYYYFKLLQNENDVPHQILVYEAVTLLYFKIGKIDSAEISFSRFMDAFDSNTDSSHSYDLDFANALNSMTLVLAKKNNFILRDSLSRRALRAAQKVYARNPKSGGVTLCLIYINIGAFYADYEFSKAKENFLNAKKIFDKFTFEDKVANYDILADVYNNLGATYIRFPYDLDSALMYLKIAQRIRYEGLRDSTLENVRSYAVLVGNIAKIYMGRRNFEEAREMINESVSRLSILYEKYPGRFDGDLAMVQCWSGTLYLMIHDTMNAERTFLKSVRLYEQGGLMLERDILIDYTSLRDIYISNDLDKAEKYGLLAIEYLEKLIIHNSSFFDKRYCLELIEMSSLYARKFRTTHADRYYEAATIYYQKSLPFLMRYSDDNELKKSKSLINSVQDFLRTRE